MEEWHLSFCIATCILHRSYLFILKKTTFLPEYDLCSQRERQILRNIDNTFRINSKMYNLYKKLQYCKKESFLPSKHLINFTYPNS